MHQNQNGNLNNYLYMEMQYSPAQIQNTLSLSFIA